jgi:hypothetical protein
MKSAAKSDALGLNPVILKPQDVALALKILAKEIRQGDECDSNKGEREWTLAQLASETKLSIGEVHNALRRLTAVRLLSAERYRLRQRALSEFLLHGIQYVFPAVRGTLTRGVTTAFSAPMLQNAFLLPTNEPLVWPYEHGTERGIALLPLYPAVPEAALSDPLYYELLALVDIIRGDVRVRERSAAITLLSVFLSSQRVGNVYEES